MKHRPDGAVFLFYYSGYTNRYERKVSQIITKPDGSKEKVESKGMVMGLLPSSKISPQAYRPASVGQRMMT